MMISALMTETWSGATGDTPCVYPMPQEPPLGVCDPAVLSRKYFALCEGVRLTVPGIRDDKTLRRRIVNGFTFEEAYKSLGYPYYLSLIPEEGGLHACLRDALETQQIDINTGDWIPMHPGNATCIDFWGCFADFINAKRETGASGRIKLGDDAYVPSLPEQECIRKDWITSSDVAASYEVCGAGDIIPTWEGGVSGLNDALRTKINVNIYDVLKSSYTFANMGIITPVEQERERTREDYRRRKAMLDLLVEERKKKSVWLYGLAAFAVGAFLMRK